MAQRYWLMKSEPDECSIDDVLAAKNRTVPWTGVRNYQARNFMRDQMQVGDGVLFYHSSCEVPGIAGIVKIVRAGYPDPTAFERGHHHYDPESEPASPRWFMVDVKLERKLARIVTLEELRTHAAGKLKPPNSNRKWKVAFARRSSPSARPLYFFDGFGGFSFFSLNALRRSQCRFRPCISVSALMIAEFTLLTRLVFICTCEFRLLVKSAMLINV